MASNELVAIMEQVEHLSPAEQLDLIAYLAQKARANYGVQRPRRWADIQGIAPYPLTGEDAQTWVSRTRQESDESR